MIITNTYFNTRIYPGEENKKQEDTNSNTFRKKLENNVPVNNRNAGQKSSTHDTAPKDDQKKTNTRLMWVDQSGKNKPLTEIIVNKNLEKAKRAKDIPKITCHKEEVFLKPIITNKIPPFKPKIAGGSMTTTTKGIKLLNSCFNIYLDQPEQFIFSQIPSENQEVPVKLMPTESNLKQEEPPKAKKRVKSARAKDAKQKKKKDLEAVKEGRTKRRKRDEETKNVEGIKKYKNNFFEVKNVNSKSFQNKQNEELQDILTKAGLNDINAK